MTNQWARFRQLSMSIQKQDLKQLMLKQWARPYQLLMSKRTQAQLSKSTRTQALKRSMPNQLT